MTTTKMPPLPAASVNLNDIHNTLIKGACPVETVDAIKADLAKAKAKKINASKLAAAKKATAKTEKPTAATDAAE